jgi:MFS family permease
MLHLTLFLCGAVVMSVEILASRVLAVEFGEDLYTWGALIGSFIAALSLGYWLGGIASDRWPSRLGLAFLSLVAGAYIIAIVSVTREVTAFVGGAGLPDRVALWANPLSASFALYGLPMTLLGAVSPYCVRIATKDMARLGRKVGSFYAISSLGSIFGTFLTAFYLVGEMRVSTTIRAEGVLLVLLSAPLFMTAKVRGRSVGRDAEPTKTAVGNK